MLRLPIAEAQNSKVPKTNPDLVKSRTGYIIEVMGCSVVVWCSKLQVHIATSTMNSKYTALSMPHSKHVRSMSLTLYYGMVMLSINCQNLSQSME